MRKSSVELGLVYKTFDNNMRNAIAAPEKQTASTVHVTLGSSGSWTRLSFPHNQKHTSCVKKTFFLSESHAMLPDEARRWMKLLLLLRLMRARARFSVRNAHIRSSTVIYVSKSHVRIKLSETCTNPEVRFLAQKYSVIHPNFEFFFKLCPWLAW